jgi:hypothetical protein
MLKKLEKTPENKWARHRQPDQLAFAWRTAFSSLTVSL